MSTFWCHVGTDPHRDFECLWWVVPKTVEDDGYCDTSGHPIVSPCMQPRMVMGKYGSWSSLEKAIFWHPLPNPPEFPQQQKGDSSG